MVICQQKAQWLLMLVITTNCIVSALLSNDHLCQFDLQECTEFQAKISKKYYEGNTVCSLNSHYQLGVSKNGDLCLCNIMMQQVWCAGILAGEDKDVFMVMQNDGNLVVYEEDVSGRKRKAIWSSRTPRNPGSVLYVKNEGIAVIASTSLETLWSTHEPMHQLINPIDSPHQQPSSKPAVSSPKEKPMEDFFVYIVGDTPYTADDFNVLRSRIKSLPLNADFLVHVGDIKRGRGRTCPLSAYTNVYNELDKSAVPVFIVPGDNDVNDCPNFHDGWNNWSNTFLSPSQVTENKWDVSNFGDVQRQTGTANFSFVYKKTMILGIDIVGGVPHDRDEWNIRHRKTVNWIMKQINIYTRTHQNNTLFYTILILGHGRPQASNEDFFISLHSRLKQNSSVDLERVLYVHGDGHSPETHTKYGLKCVQVDLGSRQWLRLKIKPYHVEPMEYDHGIFDKYA